MSGLREGLRSSAGGLDSRTSDADDGGLSHGRGGIGGAVVTIGVKLTLLETIGRGDDSAGRGTQRVGISDQVSDLVHGT